MDFKKRQIQPNWNNLGKLPPQNLEVEKQVLGLAMMFPDIQATVLERLGYEDFYLETHQEVFQAMTELGQAGVRIEMHSVASRVRKRGKANVFDGDGGVMYYVAALTSQMAYNGDIMHYCMLLVEQRMRRQMILMAMEVQMKAYEEDSDPFDTLKVIQSFPERIIDNMKMGQEKRLGESIMELAQNIKDRSSSDKVEIPGISYSYSNLERIAGRLRSGNLIIVAARPGMGKTTFVINLLRNASVDFKIPVAIFSLEMSAIELSSKAIASESEIDQHKIDQGTFSVVDWERFHSTTTDLINASIYTDDTPGLTIVILRSKLRRLKIKYGIRAVAIDYLQLMKGTGRPGGNREQEIAEITRGLKEIAKELEIPIIALSQLSRDVEKRGGDKRPQLSDLRESGSIEQDADIVMFLWRPAYYKITGDAHSTFEVGATLAEIAKNRHGGLGEVWFKFNLPISKFIALETPYATLVPGTESVIQERAKKSTAWYDKNSQPALEFNDDKDDPNEPPF